MVVFIPESGSGNVFLLLCIVVSNVFHPENFHELWGRDIPGASPLEHTHMLIFDPLGSLVEHLTPATGSTAIFVFMKVT